jgi:hypothetical protein
LFFLSEARLNIADLSLPPECRQTFPSRGFPLPTQGYLDGGNGDARQRMVYDAPLPKRQFTSMPPASTAATSSFGIGKVHF